MVHDSRTPARIIRRRVKIQNRVLRTERISYENSFFNYIISVDPFRYLPFSYSHRHGVRILLPSGITLKVRSMLIFLQSLN